MRTGQHVTGCREDLEHRTPAGTKIVYPCLQHLLETLENLSSQFSQGATDEKKLTHHFSSVCVDVVSHGIFKRLKEIFLESEMRQLFLLQETHGELS